KQENNKTDRNQSSSNQNQSWRKKRIIKGKEM
ncbi:pilus assembly protein, partial [Escherichia coli]